MINAEQPRGGAGTGVAILLYMSIGLTIEAGFFGLYKIESLADENTCNRYSHKN